MKRMPKEVLLYVADTLDDGTAVYGVAHNVADIPEESDGQKIGVYTLNRECDFRIRRELSG